MNNAIVSNPGRPETDEYNPYYGQYVSLVPEGAIVGLLERQLDVTHALLAPLSAEQAAYRPKPEDWNIIEVVGHVADAERVFAYRALCIARTDTTPLLSFDQDLYVAAANFARRPLADLLNELAIVRRASISLLQSLDAEAWLRLGTVNNKPMSVRALAYIMAGHELHHVEDFRWRYNIA